MPMVDQLFGIILSVVIVLGKLITDSRLLRGWISLGDMGQIMSV